MRLDYLFNQGSYRKKSELLWELTSKVSSQIYSGYDFKTEHKIEGNIFSYIIVSNELKNANPSGMDYIQEMYTKLFIDSIKSDLQTLIIGILSCVQLGRRTENFHSEEIINQNIESFTKMYEEYVKANDILKPPKFWLMLIELSKLEKKIKVIDKNRTIFLNSRIQFFSTVINSVLTNIGYNFIFQAAFYLFEEPLSQESGVCTNIEKAKQLEARIYTIHLSTKKEVLNLF